MKNIKIATIAAGLLLSAAYTGMAVAHSQSGTLGTTTSATTKIDKFSVTCSGGTHHLRIQLKDNYVSPELGTILSISAVKASGAACASPNGPTASTTAPNPTSAATAVYGAWAQCDGGDGDYIMSITKPAWTANGRETYVSQFHCEKNDVNRTHTTTEYSLIQNQ